MCYIFWVEMRKNAKKCFQISCKSEWKPLRHTLKVKSE